MNKHSHSRAPFSLTDKTRSLLKAALEEDIGSGDKTTDLLISKKARSKAVVIAREPGVFCGEPVAGELFRFIDPSVKVKLFVNEGEKFSKNKPVAEFEGPVSSILKVERTLLNFLGHLSGIATKTREFVSRVKKYPVFILDTRKTTPLWREMEKYAVRMGGGKNHRLGLYDRILIKENHRPYAEWKNLERFRGQFEIEVRSLKELKEALKLGPRIILFDNFSPAALHKAVQMTRHSHPEIILEASGGITLDNVAHYAALGVDWISIGSLTHSVKSIDFSLLVLK